MVEIYTRYCIVKRGCPDCLEFLKAISKVNPKLSPEKQIVIKDNFMSEEFYLQTYPIVEKFSKEGFNFYPFCYIDGIIVEPAPSQLILNTLNGILKEEYIFS